MLYSYLNQHITHPKQKMKKKYRGSGRLWCKGTLYVCHLSRLEIERELVISFSLKLLYVGHFVHYMSMHTTESCGCSMKSAVIVCGASETAAYASSSGGFSGR